MKLHQYVSYLSSIQTLQSLKGSIYHTVTTVLSKQGYHLSRLDFKEKRVNKSNHYVNFILFIDIVQTHGIRYKLTTNSFKATM